VYPDVHVVHFVREHFAPVEVHVKRHADEYARLSARFGARWTPTLLVIDPGGEVRHRVEGFLPAHDLIGQLALGLGHSAFARGGFEEAARRFQEIVERHADSEAGAEALYWAGVARYKATNDPAALADTARQFARQYPSSSWARKASVWAE
jgi:hypothetical protein